MSSEYLEKYGFIDDGRLMTLKCDNATLAEVKWAEDTKDLDVEAVAGFVRHHLLSRFDNPLPIAPIHRVLWGLVLSPFKYVAIAAPRGISKTTSMSLVMVMVFLLFRVRRYILMISAVEGLAAAFIESIRTEIMENEELKKDFGVVAFQKDNETELVIEFADGYTCCVKGKGFDQKFRGVQWRGLRPGAVVLDDIEEDEAVESPERRTKNMNKLLRAILPCGSDNCIYRLAGTVIHMDSVLNRLLNNNKWMRLMSQAQSDDKELLLWEDKLSAEKLEEIKQMYVDENDEEGFFKEYFNRPVVEGATFFNKSDFIPMTEKDHGRHKVYFAGMDCAVSEAQRADFSVIVVGGTDSDGILHIVEVVRIKAKSDALIEEMLRVQDRYKIEMFTIESENIEKTIGPFLNLEMIQRGIFMNLNRITPSKSKVRRGKSIQLMMRAGAVRFDVDAPWFSPFQQELMTITPAGPKGKHDDQFDAFAYLGLGIDKHSSGLPDDEYAEQKYQEDLEEELGYSIFDDRSDACPVTGY